MKKIVTLFSIVIFLTLLTSCVFAKENVASEECIIDAVLGSEGLDIFPDSIIGETLTHDQMAEFLIKYTAIYKDYNYAVLMELDEFYFDVKNPNYSQNPYGYIDYQITEEKGKYFSRLYNIGVFAGDKDGLFCPNSLCTWKEARNWFVHIVDRAKLLNSVGGYEEYLRKHNLYEGTLKENDIVTCFELKKLYFYSLFFTPVKKVDKYYFDNEPDSYESTSDILLLLHNKRYVIGQPVFSGGGVEINGIYFENISLDNEKTYLCIYESVDGNIPVVLVPVNEDVIKNIETIKASQNLPKVLCTFEGTSIDVNLDQWLEYEKNHKADLASLLENLKISTWADNPDETITRAQVVKTALEMGGNNFNRYKPYALMSFSDVTEDNKYYNFINAVHSAGAIVGDGTGMFYPDRPCTYGEAVKILSYMTGWGKYAEEIAKKNGDIPYPEYYMDVLKELNVFDFDVEYTEINIKEFFPELVWDFMNIPVLKKDNDNQIEWIRTPSLYAYRR